MTFVDDGARALDWVASYRDDVMELAGGCVCHEVRVQSELWAAIDEVVRRSQAELVLLETTGIAEPWSILDGLEASAPSTGIDTNCPARKLSSTGVIILNQRSAIPGAIKVRVASSVTRGPGVDIRRP